MEEKRFNLVDSPWILVLTPEDTVKKVSLENALLNAQDFKALAGETAAQNAAVLRLMIAIVHTVLTRHDEDGNESQLDDEAEALDRWEAVWKAGRLPEEEIREYLNTWKERFWLIHPDRPFLQSKTAETGTDYKAGKLIGDASESNNKLRLFQLRSGREKESLELDEAARWLLNVNGYDDTSAKTRGRTPDGGKLPSTGAGWLGKLGQVYAQGTNLFETIMLNTVLLKDGRNLWEKDNPYWERDDYKPLERNLISVPKDMASLLTLPSRLLYLKTNDDGRVAGYGLLGGDFFDKTDAFAEQYTMWRPVKGKKNEPVHYVPRRHDSARQIWRDFSSLAGLGKEKENQDVRLPGVVNWIRTLMEEDLIPRSQPILFTAPYVQYGDKDFFVTDMSSESLLLYPELLTKTGESWRSIIEEEIQLIDSAAYYAGLLAQRVAMASGDSGDSVTKFAAKGRAAAYEAVDDPFRNWLGSLDPELYKDDQARMDKKQEWQLQMRKIMFRLEKKIVGTPSVSALFSREVMRGGKTERILSVPEAEMRFESRINKLYPPIDSALKNATEGSESE